MGSRPYVNYKALGLWGVYLEEKEPTYEGHLGTSFHLRAVITLAQVTHARVYKWEPFIDNNHWGAEGG